MTITSGFEFEHDDERRLQALGLSSELIHDGLRRGAGRAANRSAFSLKSAPGTDIYLDGMEDFAQLLAAEGWRSVDVDGQPRLLHPENLVAFTISSGVNVGRNSLSAKLRTRRKGKATRNSLAPDPHQDALFEDVTAIHAAELAKRAQEAPLYLLVCERAHRGEGVHLVLARPMHMTPGGSVNGWADTIAIPFLALDGDLSVFDEPGDDAEDEFDVPVEPR